VAPFLLSELPLFSDFAILFDELESIRSLSLISSTAPAFESSIIPSFVIPRPNPSTNIVPDCVKRYDCLLVSNLDSFSCALGERLSPCSYKIALFMNISR
jgi:hypothetical protein